MELYCEYSRAVKERGQYQATIATNKCHDSYAPTVRPNPNNNPDMIFETAFATGLKSDILT